MPIPFILALLALPTPSEFSVTNVRGDCSLTVRGKLVLNIKRTCRISLFGDGGFSINTRDDNGDGRPFHFAYLSVDKATGLASVTWNEDIRFDHAHTPLGADFRRKGGCWVGRRATICAYRR